MSKLLYRLQHSVTKVGPFREKSLSDNKEIETMMNNGLSHTGIHWHCLNVGRRSIEWKKLSYMEFKCAWGSKEKFNLYFNREMIEVLLNNHGFEIVVYETHPQTYFEFNDGQALFNPSTTKVKEIICNQADYEEFLKG